MNGFSRASLIAFAAVLVAAGAVVGVVLVATDGAPAIEVGDRSISRDSVNAELEAIAENAELVARFGERLATSPGSIKADAGAALVATGVVQEALIREWLDRKGASVTAADRDAARKLLPATTIGAVFDGFPEWYRERYRERLAVYVALGRVGGFDIEDPDSTDAATRTLRREARRVGVTVDPRYGRYASSIAQVVPRSVTAADIAGAGASG